MTDDDWQPEVNDWQPAKLWNYLKDKTDGDYCWRKECRDFANCYVCYYDGKKEIGFIPVEYKETDVEWCNWWKAAYRRHADDGLTLNKLMAEIVGRHQRF